MIDWRSSELIGYEMRSLMQKNCAVLITKRQSPKGCQHFCFYSIGYLFIDLSSSTIEKFAQRVALGAVKRKVLKITEFTYTLLFKKHTGRKAGAMATSCSSTNQITAVKNLVPFKTQVIFFKIFNNTDIRFCWLIPLHLRNSRWWIYSLLKSEGYLLQS